MTSSAFDPRRGSPVMLSRGEAKRSGARMSWPASLSVALKEWAVVCRALESGAQMILLRKGGIYEAAGEFELEHRQFLLFPTYLHQNLNMLKPQHHGGFEPRSDEPDHVMLRAA